MITFIWVVYAVINILWQMAMSALIKNGFVHGDLKHKHEDAYKKVVDRASSKGQSMETAFRSLATLGMNLWLLPICLLCSIVVVII